MAQYTPLSERSEVSSGLALSASAFIRRLVLGTLLINLFAGALAGIAIYQSRQQYQERAEMATQNLAHILDEYLAGVINKIDLALLAAVDEAEDQIAAGGIDGKALTRFLAQQQDHQPEILSLRMTDASGVVRYGRGVAPGSSVNVADRDYFTRCRDDAKARLVITKPVLARISQKWAIVLARRVNQPDGSFAGAVYVNVALEHLSKTFSSIRIGPNGSIGLRDEELGLIARYPEVLPLEKGIGQKVVSQQAQDLILRERKTEATYTTRTGVDQVERVFSYRKIAGQPFYIFVGHATDDYLAGWRKDSARIAALAVLFLLATLLSARLIYSSWRRQTSASEALRTQKDFLDTILNNEPECVKVIAPNGALLQMNQAGLAMLEVDSILEAKKEGLLGFVLPAHRDAFVALSERVFAGEPGTLEFEIAGKKGTRRWLETHATPLRDTQGTITALVGVTRDITERKRAEEQLIQYRDHLEEMVKIRTRELVAAKEQVEGIEHRQRIMLEHLPVGVILSSGMEQEMLYQNPRFVEMFGYSIEEFPHVAQWWHLAYPDAEYRAAVAEEWNRRLAGAITRQTEFEPMEVNITAKDGTVKFISIHATVIGELNFVTFIDLSEHKRAEDAIRDSMEKERLLIQQSRLAAMGEMIGNIAHQWRQPLSMLGLLLANLQDAHQFNELTTESLKKTVADGNRMIQKMSSTIDDFRNFFKPNKEKEVFSLGQAVAEALRLVEHSLKDHAISVRIEDSGNIRANGFPNEFSQVLLNILTNAKDAIQERRQNDGKINVSWGCDEHSGWVTVRDNAGGIPPEILPRIFDPYFTTKEKGTGIGLYMSKMIMEHMEGRVEARNVKGGAEFRVVLPRHEGDQCVAKSAADSS